MNDLLPLINTDPTLVQEGVMQRRRGPRARDAGGVRQAFSRLRAWLQQNF